MPAPIGIHPTPVTIPLVVATPAVTGGTFNRTVSVSPVTLPLVVPAPSVAYPQAVYPDPVEIPLRVPNVSVIAGAASGLYSLPDDVVPERLRVDFFAHSVTRSGSVITEGTGARLGTGPLVGGVVAFQYTPAVNAAGQFSLTVNSLDEGSQPVLDGTAKELKVYHENLALAFHGRIHNTAINADGQIEIRGFDLAIELTGRSMEYGTVTDGKKATDAYAAIIDHLSTMGWWVMFEADETLTLPKIRYRHETVLEALSQANEITAWNWRVHPAARQLTIGPLGDSSGLKIAPVPLDDPEIIRDRGVIALTDFRYTRDETQIINRVIPQGSNTSFGTSIDLRHAHSRRDLIGDAELLYPGVDVVTRWTQINNEEIGKEYVRRQWRPYRHSVLGMPTGGATEKGFLNTWLNYSDDGGSGFEFCHTASRVALAEEFIFDADTDLHWVAARWAGIVLTEPFVKVEVPGRTLRDRAEGKTSFQLIPTGRAPWMRIYGDSSGSPDEGNPITPWIEMVNKPGATTADCLFLDLPAVETIYPVAPAVTLTGGTKYWAVFARDDSWGYKQAAKAGVEILKDPNTPGAGETVPVAAEHFVLPVISWLVGSPYTGVGTLAGRRNGQGSFGTGTTPKFRNAAGAWSNAPRDLPFDIELSGLKTSSTFPYAVKVIAADTVNEDTATLSAETNTHGHRIMYMENEASIDANGLFSRVVSFPQVRDSTPGLEDVWPQSDALYDAAATLLNRASSAFEQVQGEAYSAGRKPFVGQTVDFFFRGLHETEAGTRVWLDLDKAFYVSSFGWKITDEGLSHPMTLTSIPEDYLNPNRIMNQVLRNQKHHDSFFAEVETGTNSGATVDPDILESGESELVSL